jgi:uncharacterized protein YcbX
MQIDSLWRYPIKGLSPERLPVADLTPGHGFPCDRAYAVTDGSFDFDEHDPAPMAKSHFLMLAKYARLALLKTHMDTKQHELTVQGFGEPQRFFLNQQRDRAALAVFLTSYLAVPLRGQARVAYSPGHRFTDVSVHSAALMHSISLFNLATLRDLEYRIGKSLDPRRFRANVYFDGARPWSELNWVGRQLRCGDVVLKIIRRTRRCPATSVNLSTGTRDLDLPHAIRDYMGHGDCGIYAEVVASGRLEPGAAINIVAAADA